METFSLLRLPTLFVVALLLMAAPSSTASTMSARQQKFFHDATTELNAARSVPTDTPVEERDRRCGSLAKSLVSVIFAPDLVALTVL